MIDLVIFDCDGVLVDSELLAAAVTSDLLAEFGIAMPVEEVLDTFVGLDAAAVHALLETRYGGPLPGDFAERERRLMEAAFATLAPIAGVVETLSALPLPFCVASNSGHKRLARSFAVTGLAGLVAGRVFSAEDVARGKPAPDVYLHAAARMGAQPERCLVLEDSTAGVRAARAAGMRVVGFCGGGHIRPGHAARLTALGAEQIIDDFRAIAALLPVAV